MSKAYDVIIIGGGHNGLTAATLLAKQGKSVLLLERRPILGGIAAGEEFHPGYRTAGLLDDTSQIDPKVVSALQLEQYGLKLQKHRPSVALLTKDKGTLTLHHDTEQTVNEILRVSPLDAEAYRKYRGFIGEVSPFFNSLFSSMPPDLSGFDSKRLLKLAQLGLKLKRLGKRTMVELLKVAPMSVSDFLDDYFESDALKSGMALPAIRGSFTSPRSAYTTLNLLKWECSASASIVGGAAALIDALAKAAEAAKVEIRTGAEVEEILLDDQRTAVGVRLIGGKEQRASVIASSATPRHTFFDLLAPHHLSHDLEQDIQHYRSRGMTAKMHLAVDGQINFGSNTPTTTHARTCSNWLDMEKAFDPTKYGQYSSHPHWRSAFLHLMLLSLPRMGTASSQSWSTTYLMSSDQVGATPNATN